MAKHILKMAPLGTILKVMQKSFYMLLYFYLYSYLYFCHEIVFNSETYFLKLSNSYIFQFGHFPISL